MRFSRLPLSFIYYYYLFIFNEMISAAMESISATQLRVLCRLFESGPSMVNIFIYRSWVVHVINSFLPFWRTLLFYIDSQVVVSLLAIYIYFFKNGYESSGFHLWQCAEFGEPGFERQSTILVKKPLQC